MARIALATTAAARGLDEDWAPLAQALAARGHRAEDPSWDDPAIDWSAFDLVVLRSTWNYIDDLPRFLAWYEATARATRVANPPSVVAWSTDKRYVHDLERAGVPVVPSAVSEPGEEWVAPQAPEFVVKPTIGAGSRGARRFGAHEADEAREHARSLLGRGLAVLTQPYVGSVDTRGETALVLYAGEFSHAFNKGPLLRAGAGDVQGLFATESIRAATPTASELGAARRAVAAVPGGAPLYARVDLVAGEGDEPLVLELELVEPSMYFAYATGSAARFVAALEHRLQARRG
jgi:hypothetical protein